MIEVAPGLFVGNALDWENLVKDKSSGKPKDGWAALHCAKEPFHREAVGYTGRACDREHPEYLFAFRGERLCLNMVDAPKPEFFSEAMVTAGLNFIESRLGAGLKVIVNCNQGGSRAPGIALLYLRVRQEMYGDMSFEEAEDFFRGIYPAYQPAGGIRGYLAAHWDD